MEFFDLSNGVKIPCIGTGPSSVERAVRWTRIKWLDKIPWFGRRANSVLYRYYYWKAQKKWVDVLATSLKSGYRLIDYSSAYGDGKLINRAIIKSGIKRENLFIITRATNNDQYNHRVRESFMKSMENIGVNYIDLYMFL